MKSGHTRDTKMNRIYKKEYLSYEENWQRSLEIVKKVQQSPFVDQVVIFTECQLAEYWFSPVSHLEKKLNLSLKSGINKTIPLKNFIVETASTQFPLLKKNQGFKETELLHLVKNENINALISISGYCDAHILKEFNIFAIKDDQKTIYTNEITQKIVTVPFLSLLLKEKSLNFNLTSIEKVYLYPNCHFNPFKEKSEHLLQMINDHKSHESIVGFLKNINNFFIGSLSFNPNSYKSKQVISKTDSVNMDWTKFQGSFSLNEHFSICTFNNNQHFLNNIHNHFQLISYAKSVFLHFATGVAKWTDGELRICNTGEPFLRNSNFNFVH